MFIPDTKTYEFGPFRLAPHQGLYKNGDYVPLPPKELAALCALVARHGNLVTKQQLFDEVWPRDIVSDESLSRCIYVLRRTLDTRNSRSHIQTMHRRGYRFVAKVRALEFGSPSTELTESQLAALDQCRFGFSRLGFGSRGDTEEAIRCFEQALKIDSNCAIAYSGLCDVAIVRASYGWTTIADARQILRSMTDLGLTLAPHSGELLATSALVAALFEWDWPRAQRESLLAMQTPNNHKAYLARGIMELCLGNTAEAIELLNASVKAAPYVPYGRSLLTLAYFVGGNHDAALAHARHVSTMLPSITIAFEDHATVAGHCGFHDEAITAARRAVQLCDNEPHALAVLVTALNQSGNRSEALKVHEEIKRSFTEYPPVWSCLAYPILTFEGEQPCLDALEEALQKRCCLLPIRLTDPRLKSLHSNKRFQRIRQEVLVSASLPASTA